MSTVPDLPAPQGSPSEGPAIAVRGLGTRGAHLGEVAVDVADLGIELSERDFEGIRHDDPFALFEHLLCYV